MKVYIHNETIGVTRAVKVGFSWVILFFGFIPFMLRGMLVHASLILAWNVVVFLSEYIKISHIGMEIFYVVFCNLVLAFICNLVLAFMGNKMTVVHYLERGYKRTGTGWDYANAKWGFVVK